MTVLVQDVLRNPLGSPIPNATIRLTAQESIGGMPKAAESTHTTNELGEYSFDLSYGNYLLEVNSTDEFVITGSVLVDEFTPTPLTLIELVQYSTPVTTPVVVPEDANWADLHNDLTDGLNTSVRTNTAQISDDTVLVNEQKTLNQNDVIDADSAQHNVLTQSRTAQVNRQAFAYEDGVNNQSIQVTETGATETAQMSKSTEVYEASNGKVSIHKAESITTPSGTVTEHIDLDDTELSGTRTLNHGTSNIEETVSVDATGIQRELTTEITDVISGKRTEELLTEYRDDDSVLVTDPKIVLGSEVNLSSGIHEAQVYEKQEALVDKDDQLQTTQEKGILAYLKKAFQRITNNGITSQLLTRVDNYTLQNHAKETVFNVDTVNKTLTLNGTLVVNNTEDFKGDAGDTIYEVFQYSVDNVNWHDDWVIADLYRRHATSTNGVLSNWSAGYLLQAQDGANGDTTYVDYQYSDDTINWHDTFVDGDIWRKERTIVNNVPQGLWSESARIVGADGEPGDTVYIEYQYSVDGFDPWHSNFQTGDHYRRERLVTNGTPATWSSASLLVPRKDYEYFDGIQGNHGNGSYIIQVNYQTDIPTDTGKDAHILGVAGRTAQDGDLITYNGLIDSFSTSYLRESGSWTAFTFQVDGNAIINGTLAAEKLQAATITGDKINSDTILTGHIQAKTLTFYEDVVPENLPSEIANSTVQEYVATNYVPASVYSTDIADLQNQIDGSITTWFYSGEPTLENTPASTWPTSEDKDTHVGDIYYDEATGYAYRFQVVLFVYSWVRISDEGIAQALSAASTAQDTADSKRRVFAVTPTVPYDVGDLWVTNTAIKSCVTASTTTYNSSHWETASDVTDYTAAQQTAEAYADAQLALEQTRADAYADGVADAAELAAITSAQAKADLAEVNAKNYADGEITASETAMQTAYQAYADAAENAAVVTANAYADGEVSAEEARAIADATVKANAAEIAAKAYTDTKTPLVFQWEGSEGINTSTTISGADDWTFESSYEGKAVLGIKGYDFEGGIRAGFNQTDLGTMDAGADDTDNWFYFPVDLVLGTNEISIWSSSVDGGSTKAIEVLYTGIDAVTEAQIYTDAQLTLADTTLKAYADGIVTTEETRAIADAQAKADAAEAAAKAASDPVGSASTAQSAAEAYALAQANLAETTAKAYSDGIVTQAEADAIAEAQVLALAAETAAQDYTDINWDKFSATPVGTEGAIQISGGDFIAGQQGWGIDSAGNVEFNDVTVRGHVEATSGSITNLTANNVTIASDCTVNGDISGATGSFSGTVYAPNIEGDVANYISFKVAKKDYGEYSPLPISDWHDVCCFYIPNNGFALRVLLEHLSIQLVNAKLDIRITSTGYTDDTTANTASTVIWALSDAGCEVTENSGDIFYKSTIYEVSTIITDFYRMESSTPVYATDTSNKIRIALQISRLGYSSGLNYIWLPEQNLGFTFYKDDATDYLPWQRA